MSDRKKVLILLAGGLWNDSRVLKIAKSLSIDFEVDVWCYEGGVSTDTSFSVFSIKKKNGIFLKLYDRSLFWLPFHLNTSKLRKGAKFNYDLVWANDLNTLYTGVKLSKQHNSKLIYDSHEIFIETINQFFPTNTFWIRRTFHKFNCILMKFLGRIIEKRCGDRADFVFAANDSFKDVLITRYHWSKIDSIYNVPELNIVKSLNLKTTVRDSFTAADTILVYHGVFNSGRGLELLIRALKYLPTEFKLALIGAGFLKTQLQELTTELGLKNRLVFIPMIPENELIEYISSADIGLNILEKFNLSKWLASPNKLFQYMYAGLPVVCSKSPENIKVLSNHKIGILTDNTPQAIGEAIINLNRDMSTFSKENFRAISKDYNWEKYEKLLIEKALDLTSQK